MSSTLPTHVVSLKYVIIYRTHTLSNLCQSWKIFRQDLAAESPYQASIGGIRMRLVELQAEDSQARKIRAKKLGGNEEDCNRILHHQGLPYVYEIIKTKLISKHHNDPLVGHFGIKKTQELVAKKYYWETLRHDIEVYIRGYDVCLVFKTVKYKPYGNLQQVPVPTHCQKDLFIDFVMELPQSADWRGNGYDSILVIIDWLTKMVYYKLVQTTIIAPALAEVILNIVV